MFKNRSFLVKVIKDNDTTNESQSIDYNQLVRTITRSIIAIVAVQIGADTIRRVIVYTASAKI